MCSLRTKFRMPPPHYTAPFANASGLPSPSVFARGRDTLIARAVSHRTSPTNKATAVAVLGQAASASMRSQAHNIAWPIRRQLFLMAH